VYREVLSRLDVIDERFEQVDRRFEGVDAKLDRMNDRILSMTGSSDSWRCSERW
jgi:tetrahydromethanopterin S-methyltransferase subunit G